MERSNWCLSERGQTLPLLKDDTLLPESREAAEERYEDEEREDQDCSNDLLNAVHLLNSETSVAKIGFYCTVDRIS